MSAHLVNGEFQSDKYPTCPPGKVPLSVKDVTAQDLLWEYAQRRREVDAEFAEDLETALLDAGYLPGASGVAEIRDAELMRRAVGNARGRDYRRGVKHWRWVAVMDVFALGSTYAHQLCRRFNLDPDEMVKR